MVTVHSRADLYDAEVRNSAAVRAYEAGETVGPSIVIHQSAAQRAFSARKLTAPNLINAAHMARRADYIVKIADQSGRWLHTITADERRALTSPAKQTEAAREIVGRYKETENVQ